MVAVLHAIFLLGNCGINLVMWEVPTSLMAGVGLALWTSMALFGGTFIGLALEVETGTLQASDRVHARAAARLAQRQSSQRDKGGHRLNSPRPAGS
jgi:hypothetical protein